MDISVSGSVMNESMIGPRYVSCIEIDGRPILPPVMNEAKRAEMRRYRELAMDRERYRKQAWRLKPPLQAPDEGSQSEAFLPDSAFMSTPLSDRRVPNTSSTLLNSNSGGTPFFDKSAEENNKTMLEVHPVKESLLTKFDTHFVIKKPYRSPEQASHTTTGLKTVVMTEAEKSPSNLDSEDDSSDKSSEDGNNFASATSSTGTFIIKSDRTQWRRERECLSDGEIEFEEENSEDEMESLKRDEDDDEGDGSRLTKPEGDSKPGTMSTTPILYPNSRRKRPATYFDSDDENEPLEDQEISKDTSLGKYCHPDITWTSTVAFQSESESAETQTQGSSRGFDVSLSKEVPSSAEASPKAPDEKAENSEDSDKENREKSRGKHVRRLSYTLLTPSAALLATMKDDREAPAEDAEVANALSTIPSSNATPVKSSLQIEPPTPSNEQLDERLENLNRHLAELQLGMGLNKKKHLERYLGDAASRSSPAAPDETEVQARLRALQLSHRKEVEALVEKHRQQELCLKTDLERERMDFRVLSVQSETHDRSPRRKSPRPSEDGSSFYVPPPAPAEKSEGRPYGPIVDTSPSKHSGYSCASSKQSFFSSVSQRRSATPEKGSNQLFEQQSVSLSLTEGSTVSAGTSVVSFISVGDSTGLSRLQSRMKMSPGMFKTALETRSPLLKGVVFMDPLDRPKGIKRIPLKASDPSMKPKFDRLTAAVKGYLVRRLLNTEKIQILIQTIRDTVELLLKLYDEAPQGRDGSGCQVKPEEAELNRRLLQQLHGACASFHDIFFKLSTKERMAIIATDREKIRSRASKHKNPPGSPTKRNISTATLKSMERRMSVANPSTSTSQRSSRKTIVPDRSLLPLQVPSRYVAGPHVPLGSQTVKPKPVRSYIVSPKRRRMSLSLSARSLQPQSGKPKEPNSNSSRSSTSSSLSFKAKPKAGSVSKKDAPSRGRKLDATYTTSKLTSAYRPRQSTAR